MFLINYGLYIDLMIGGASYYKDRSATEFGEHSFVGEYYRVYF